jgi:hypothetical protein
MVTVVDCHSFLLDYQTKEGVLDRYADCTRLTCVCRSHLALM